MMQKLIAVFLSIIFCTTIAWAQKTLFAHEVSTVTTNDGKQLNIIKENKKPLSGNCRIVNERLSEYTLCHYRKGYPNGAFQRFRHGVLKESGTYDNGIRHGVWTDFQPDGATPRRQTPLTHGKINGTVRTFFNDGKLQTEKEYVDSQQQGAEQRFDAQTGEVIYQATYQNGKRQGKVVKTHRGTKGKSSITISHYIDGKRDGDYTVTFLLNGAPPPAGEVYQILGKYTGDQKSGIWKQTDCNGNILHEWKEK